MAPLRATALAMAVRSMSLGSKAACAGLVSAPSAPVTAAHTSTIQTSTTSVTVRMAIARCARPESPRPMLSRCWLSTRSASAPAGSISSTVTTAEMIPGTPSQNGDSVSWWTSQPAPMKRNCVASTIATLESQ